MKRTCQEYVLITAAKNEAAFLGDVIERVAAQTVKPARWVIVDDGSTDHTPEVVQKYLPTCDFLRLLRIAGDDGRHFGKKASAFNAGLELLRDVEYAYIGNLDADIILPPDYYERILSEFQHDRRLGVAGGAVETKLGAGFVPLHAATDSVSGAVQLFRNKCFAAIGGRYLPLERGGIDAAAEIMARMAGWKVRQFPGIRAYEQRRTGTASSGMLRAKYREGVTFHSLGYGILFYLFRAVYKFRERPFVIGSLAAVAGFLCARFTGCPVSLPREVVDYLRSEQKQKLRHWIAGPRPGAIVPEA